MALTPAPDTNTFGRDSFLIHGDSSEHPGAASRGCIILPRNIRDQIAAAAPLATGDNRHIQIPNSLFPNG